MKKLLLKGMNEWRMRLGRGGDDFVGDGRELRNRFGRIDGGVIGDDGIRFFEMEERFQRVVVVTEDSFPHS